MSTKSRLTQKKKQKNFMVEVDTKEVKNNGKEMVNFKSSLRRKLLLHG